MANLIFLPVFLCLTAHKDKVAAYPYVKDQRGFSVPRPVPSSFFLVEMDRVVLDD